MEKLKCGVYKITNKNTGHFYIGSSSDISIRWYGHMSTLRLGNNSSRKMQAEYDQFGKENFVFETLIYCDPETRLLYEQMFIKALKPFYNTKNVDEQEGLAPAWDEAYNNRKTHKIPILVSPNRQLYVGIKNLKEFCKLHKLNYICTYRLCRGYVNSYRGWERL